MFGGSYGTLEAMKLAIGRMLASNYDVELNGEAQ